MTEETRRPNQYPTSSCHHQRENYHHPGSHPDHKLQILSDDECSEYVDPNFDPDLLEILEEQIAVTRPIRGKTFIPKKPEAPVTKDKKVERLNQVSEVKEKEKNQRKEVLHKRITTRNMKRMEKEKKEPPAKRLRSRQNTQSSFYKK